MVEICRTSFIKMNEARIFINFSYLGKCNTKIINNIKKKIALKEIDQHHEKIKPHKKNERYRKRGIKIN